METDSKVIIGIVGRKQSGKDSTADYIIEKSGTGRKCSFADKLKRDVCINLLGLTEKQCYGSDEDKNTLTNLKWEDMPGVLTDKDVRNNLYNRSMWAENNNRWQMSTYLMYHEPGFMTAREVMQFVGTEIFRKMYSNVWVDALIREIKNDQDEKLFIIPDVRFPNEADAIKEAGGQLWKFTRKISNDKHASETGMDEYPLDNYDVIFENQTMSLKSQLKWCYEAYQDIASWEESPYETV